MLVTTEAEGTLNTAVQKNNRFVKLIEWKILDNVFGKQGSAYH